jgi:hypothetical protein
MRTAQILLLEKAVRLAPGLGHEAVLDRALDAADRLRGQSPAAPSSQAHSSPLPRVPGDAAGGALQTPPASPAADINSSSGGKFDTPSDSPHATAGSAAWGQPPSPTASTSSRYSDGGQSAGMSGVLIPEKNVDDCEVHVAVRSS